ncbi:MAG TPA: hypothetical protein VKX40_17160 [Aequorivita sp.]|nr:hypothetical protein [Aequorivita sp.]
MRKTRKNTMIACVLAMMLTAPLTFAQTYTPEKENNTEGGEVVLQGQNVSPEMLGIFTTPNPKNATIKGNAVFLRQIGDYNTASIQTRTNASEINVLQNGSSNDAQLNYTANTAVADLIQNGNFNSIKDFVNKPDMDISIDLVQDGNGLQFERNGANELTKSIKFRQSEASPTIIVRSFN